MRASSALFALALVACDSLHDPPDVAPEVKRCPRPCPATCPHTCYPDGFCREETLTEATVRLTPAMEASTSHLVFRDLPPDAPVRVSLRLGVDVGDRDGRSSWSCWVTVGVPETACDVEGEEAAFPVWREWSGQRTSASDGTLTLDLHFDLCRGDVETTTCLFDPASTFVATVADDVPYDEAPACD